MCLVDLDGLIVLYFYGDYVVGLCDFLSVFVICFGEGWMYLCVLCGVFVLWCVFVLGLIFEDFEMCMCFVE